MENLEISRVVDQYREDGYLVIIQPSPEDLPDFLEGYRPELLASKAGENVIIAVISKEGLKRNDHLLAYWMGKVNSQEGWRFDLIINDSSPWSDQVSRNARDRDLDDIRDRTRQAARAFDPAFPEPAYLFAWSLAEAALRVIAERFGVRLKNKMPDYVIKQLYTDGILSGADLDRLNELMTIRNSVAHGLKTPDLNDRVINALMDMNEKLLTIAESAKQRLAEASH